MQQGLLRKGALKVTSGFTRKGVTVSRLRALQTAIMHLAVLQAIADGDTPGNVFTLGAKVTPNYRIRRNQLLCYLPNTTEFVNLQTYRPAGRKVKFQGVGQRYKWLQKSVFNMQAGLSPSANSGMQSYVVSPRGASCKRVLRIGRSYTRYRYNLWKF